MVKGSKDNSLHLGYGFQRSHSQKSDYERSAQESTKNRSKKIKKRVLSEKDRQFKGIRYIASPNATFVWVDL